MIPNVTVGVVGRCQQCGIPLSDAPEAQYSHKMKHVREGTMRRVQRPTPAGQNAWHFEVVDGTAAQ